MGSESVAAAWRISHVAARASLIYLMHSTLHISTPYTPIHLCGQVGRVSEREKGGERERGETETTGYILQDTGAPCEPLTREKDGV
jgi:hypothetical protein